MRLTDELSTIAEESERVAGQNDLNQRKELFADSVREMVTGMVTDGYSQSQEFDADDYAAALLAKTGYAPSGLIDVLKILESRQPGQAGGFNKTHPSPAQRIANAEGAAKQYPAPDTRSFRASRFQGAK
jgi:predicted Zn-dependent protease